MPRRAALYVSLVASALAACSGRDLDVGVANAATQTGDQPASTDAPPDPCHPPPPTSIAPPPSLTGVWRLESLDQNADRSVHYAVAEGATVEVLSFHDDGTFEMASSSDTTIAHCSVASVAPIRCTQGTYTYSAGRLTLEAVGGPFTGAPGPARFDVVGTPRGISIAAFYGNFYWASFVAAKASACGA